MADPVPVRFEENILGRWIIRLALPSNRPFAWSGAHWVPIDGYGLPIATQVCNFKTKVAAVAFASGVSRFKIGVDDLLLLPGDPEDED